MLLVPDKTKLLILCALLITLPINGKELFDPTRPPSTNKTSPAQTGVKRDVWLLESIVLAPDRRVAVINGQRVNEGDSVNNAIVIRIRKLDVLIQTSNEKRIILHLLPDIVKKLQ